MEDTAASRVVVELIGVAGAGKRSIASALVALDDEIRARPRVRARTYAATVPTLLPTFLRLQGTTTLEDLGRGINEKDQLSLLDLLWVCAARMAPKSFDPQRTRGIRPVYSFLEPAIVSFSMRLSWDVKSRWEYRRLS